MDYWKGKVAVVTGASSGIGAAITLELANAGVKVFGLARRVDRVQELAKQTSGNICAIECDVSKVESITSAFNEINSKYGRLDILVNNAGRSVTAQTLDPDISHEEILKTIDVNLSGLIVCTREAYKLMKKHQDNAFIININSILGHLTPNALMAKANVYAATKHAVTNHTETVRLDIANGPDAKRIRVSSISPGFVRTEIMEASGLSQDEIEAYIKTQPFLESIEIAKAVSFVISCPPNVSITELTIKPTGEPL